MVRLARISLSLLSTISSKGIPSDRKMTLPRLYSAWFCPYAQRVWAALNELHVDFELVESLGSGMDATYTKHPDLLRDNPKGLVPTLSFPDEEKVYCESISILKHLYLDHNGDASDEVLSALETEAVWWNKVICSPFYRVLMKQDTVGREKGWNDMLQGLEQFSEKLRWKPNGGGISHYEYDAKLSDDLPSLVDFTVFPFVYRLYIIQHYCNFCLANTEGISDEAVRKLNAWQAKMEDLPSVRKTLADEKGLIDVYKRYSDGTAQSKVGDAVRQGKEAHDI